MFLVAVYASIIVIAAFALYRDMRRIGREPLPWVLLLLVTNYVGVVAYLGWKILHTKPLRRTS
ncbi:MAG TPA: hypothetical protein VF698_09870 [Thermoanaerobaculia bacterium]